MIGMSIALGASTPASGPVPLVTMADLFTRGGRGAYYDASDPDNMAQLSDGTTAAEIGDPAGYLADLSEQNLHATQSVAGDRLAIAGAGGGVSYLSNGGTADHLLSGAFAPTTAGVFTLIAGVRGAAGGAAGQGMFGLSDSTAKTDNTKFVGLRSSGNSWQMWDGGSVRNSGVSSDLSPIVITIIGDATNTNNYVLRINGSPNTNGAITSRAPFTVANSVITILPPIANLDDVGFAAGLFIDRILDAEEIAFAEGIVASATGVSL